MGRDNHSQYNPTVIDDSIDLLQLLLDIFSKWKLVVAITLISALFSIAVALMTQKVYRAKIDFTLPSDADITVLNENSYGTYTSQEVFKRFYETMLSKVHFSEFIEQKGWLARLFPEVSDIQSSKQRYLGIAFELMEARVTGSSNDDKQNYLLDNNGFSLGFYSVDEALAVEMLNDYTYYIDELVKRDIKAAEARLIGSRSNEIIKKVQSLKDIAKQNRTYEVERLRVANAERLAMLEQKKQVLIEKAKGDRETEIAKLEENNTIALARLEMRKKLLVEKVRKDREFEVARLQEANRLKLKELEQKRALIVIKAENDTQVKIAKAKEALKIAKVMKIVYPTRIADFSQRVGDRGTTEISFNGQQELPLYLMGTNYLETWIKTLTERGDESQYLDELNQIDFDIALLKEDIKLAALKAREQDNIYVDELNKIDVEIGLLRNDPRIEYLRKRESDAVYLEELNKIDAEIKAVKDDKRLVALLNRQSDEPFIDELPQLKDEFQKLKSLSLDYSEINSYVVVTPALVSGRAVKPNRPFIAIFGTVFGGILAVFIALILVTLENRKRRERNLEQAQLVQA